MAGYCPKCSKPVERLETENVPLDPKNYLGGVTYSCPACKTVLGAGFNPWHLLERIRNG
jgi:endogenous inhibitor of DNA gyrase (YacG/DUF329 family)